VGDANTGWTRAAAINVCRAAKDIDCFIEQPCPTLEECEAVKSATPGVPFVLDECIDEIRSLLDAWRTSSADAVNIKISKFGGLTKAKQVKCADDKCVFYLIHLKAVDLCAELGIAMTIEDCWAGNENCVYHWKTT